MSVIIQEKALFKSKKYAEKKCCIWFTLFEKSLTKVPPKLLILWIFVIQVDNYYIMKCLLIYYIMVRQKIFKHLQILLNKITLLNLHKFCFKNESKIVLKSRFWDLERSTYRPSLGRKRSTTRVSYPAPVIRS
jgi:hypothetical protein